MAVLHYLDPTDNEWKPLGLTGPAGAKGADGAPGPRGEPGAIGPEGPPNVGAPLGTIVPYAGSVAPEGWHICDGSAHGSVALEALIGSPNTPDLRGKFLLAASAEHPATQTGGAEAVKLTVAQSGLRDHSHSASATNTDINHTHSGNTNTVDTNHRHSTGVRTGGSGGIAAGWDGNANEVIRQVSGGYWYDPATGYVMEGAHYHSHAFETGWMNHNNPHTHGVTVGDSGPRDAADPHDNMPPFYAVVYIIKKFTDAVAEHGFTREEAEAQFVNVAGDTMTGLLTMADAVVDGYPGVSAIRYGEQGVIGGYSGAGNEGLKVWKPDLSGFLPLSVASPTHPDHTANKGYVDAKVRGGLAIVSSDPSGVALIPHGLGRVPFAAVVTVGVGGAPAGWYANILDYDAIHIRCGIYSAGGAPTHLSTVYLHWIAL